MKRNDWIIIVICFTAIGGFMIMIPTIADFINSLQ